jgi:hypothetical protein
MLRKSSIQRMNNLYGKGWKMGSFLAMINDRRVE